MTNSFFHLIKKNCKLFSFLISALILPHTVDRGSLPVSPLSRLLVVPRTKAKGKNHEPTSIPCDIFLS